MTRAIQKLEEELGGALIYRERSLTQLTELGQAMLPHLETAYGAAEAATEQAVAFRRREFSPLRLGLGMTISARILRPALRELEERVKGFELSIAEGGSTELSAKMLDGELDAAVLVEPDKVPERLNRWPLFEERYVVLCAAEHRLAALDEVPVTALADESVLARASRGCDFEQALDRLCTEAGIKPKTRHTGSSDDHIQEMVRAGLGIAVSAGHQPIAADLVARPIVDAAAARQIVLAAVAGRQHGPALALFLKLMRARDWTTVSGAPSGASKS